MYAVSWLFAPLTHVALRGDYGSKGRTSAICDYHHRLFANVMADKSTLFLDQFFQF